MLSGHPPFNGKSEAEIFSKISRGVFNFSGKEWTGISKDAKNFIQRLLTRDPNKRVTAEEAWSDSWVQNRAKGNGDDVAVDLDAMTNLARFRTTSKLQQATLSFIAYNMLTGSEINELREAFVILDSNGDGRLSPEELKNGYNNLTLSAAIDIDKIISNCDSDLNGMVDYHEFITAAVSWQKTLTQDMIEKTFKAFDRDRSGTISLQEIKEFFGDQWAEVVENWNEFLKEIEKDADGEITIGEFKTMLARGFGIS
jgi:calcium-dependent protein kinase